MTKHFILIRLLMPVVFTCGLLAAASVTLSLLFDEDSPKEDGDA